MPPFRTALSKAPGNRLAQGLTRLSPGVYRNAQGQLANQQGQALPQQPAQPQPLPSRFTPPAAGQPLDKMYRFPEGSNIPDRLGSAVSGMAPGAQAPFSRDQFPGRPRFRSPESAPITIEDRARMLDGDRRAIEWDRRRMLPPEYQHYDTRTPIYDGAPPPGGYPRGGGPLMPPNDGMARIQPIGPVGPQRDLEQVARERAEAISRGDMVTQDYNPQREALVKQYLNEMGQRLPNDSFRPVWKGPAIDGRGVPLGTLQGVGQGVGNMFQRNPYRRG